MTDQELRDKKLAEAIAAPHINGDTIARNVKTFTVYEPTLKGVRSALQKEMRPNPGAIPLQGFAGLPPITGAKEAIVIKTVADLLDHKIRQAEAEVARLNKIKAETPTVVLGCQLDFINKLKGLI